MDGNLPSASGDGPSASSDAQGPSIDTLGASGDRPATGGDALEASGVSHRAIPYKPDSQSQETSVPHLATPDQAEDDTSLMVVTGSVSYLIILFCVL